MKALGERVLIKVTWTNPSIAKSKLILPDSVKSDTEFWNERIEVEHVGEGVPEGILNIGDRVIKKKYCIPTPITTLENEEGIKKIFLSIVDYVDLEGIREDDDAEGIKDTAV